MGLRTFKDRRSLDAYGAWAGAVLTAAARRSCITTVDSVGRRSDYHRKPSARLLLAEGCSGVARS